MIPIFKILKGVDRILVMHSYLYQDLTVRKSVVLLFKI